MSVVNYIAKTVPLTEGRYALSNRLWQGVPSIQWVPGGALYASWYSGGSVEPSLYNFAIVARSDDGGLTWRELFGVDGDADDALTQVLDPQLWLSPDGVLWLFWVQRDYHAGWFDPRHLDTYAMTCADPAAAEPRFSAPFHVCNGFLRNRPLVMSDGRWLLPAYRPSDRERYAYYESPDGGRSFLLRNAGRKVESDFDESMLFTRQDGTLVLWSRALLKFGHVAQTVSADGGATWSDGALTGIPSPQTRFFVQRLPSGRLLFINNFDTQRRVNMRVCLSEDDGATWPFQLPLDNRNEVSYPDATMAPDGAIHVIHDRDRPGAKEILCSRVREEDILAGELKCPDSYQCNIVSKGPAVPALGESFRQKAEKSDHDFMTGYWAKINNPT